MDLTVTKMDREPRPHVDVERHWRDGQTCSSAPGPAGGSTTLPFMRQSASEEQEADNQFQATRM